MDLPIWAWVAIAAVILVIIIVVVIVATRGKGEARNRERAAELRSRAAEDDQLITTRQDRADELETEAEAARRTAMAEYERGESLRKEAGESDELAAQATDQARVLHEEATHSREELDAAVEEHQETLREADRRDPDIHTDRHGNRIQDTDKDSHEDVVVIPEEERLDVGDDYSGDEFAEPDAEYIDPVEHDRLAQLDDAPRAEHEENIVDDGVVPSEREPDEDYMDPVDHDRLAQQDEAALAEHDASVVDDTVAPAEPEVAETDGAGTDPTEPMRAEPAIGEDDSVVHTDEPEHAREDEAPALDPYGNPVTMDNDGVARGAHAVQVDDTPRDDQGRLLDPYGNPVHEAPENEAPDNETFADDPVMSDDADDDLPRDEQGRRLDPYGNPVPENLQ